MTNDELPAIAILVAVRDEEKNIGNCLKALSMLDYPAEKMEILIGDDQSSDSTVKIITNFLQEQHRIELVMIKGKVEGLYGKANVLAQLASRTTAAYIFMTDADVLVKPSWVRSMLKAFSPEVVFVSGPTAVRGVGLFSRFQNADWLYNLGVRYVSGRLGRPMAASGTNMAIKRSVYLSVGGYEKVTRSIAEDYDLFQKVMQHKFGFATVLDTEALVYTDPMPSFRALIQQQRRWLTSVWRMPFIYIAGLLFQNTFMILILCLALYFESIFIAGLYLIKWVAESVLLGYTFRRLKLKAGIPLYLYPVYAGICNAVFLLSYLFGRKNMWKGRAY